MRTIRWVLRMRVLSPYVVALFVLAFPFAGSLGTPGARAGSTGSAVAGASPMSRAVAARESRMRSVIHAWSARLNAGDNAGVARLFGLPAIVVQGPYAFRLRTRAQIAEWHSGFPCSGRVVSIAFNGRYATVVFRLGDRGSTPCDQPGSLAAARFEIVDGKIVSWVQIPVPAKQQAQSGPAA